MTDAGLPRLDVARAQRWCASQVPERIRSEIRVECDVAPRHLTICECRPPWCEDVGPDWTRFPMSPARVMGPPVCHEDGTGCFRSRAVW
jgi:hypothetical protein